MKPFFSIVIPTLNEEKYLPKLLDDLSIQSSKTFEVIIVDGDSKDKTVECVGKFKGKLDIKLYTTKKRNVSYQRNLGAQKTQGKYIIFLDADSRIKYDFIEKLTNEIASSKYLLYIPKIRPDSDDYIYRSFLKLVNYLVELSQFTAKPFSSGGSFIIEKSLFTNLGGFNEKVYISEDHEIIREAKRRGVHAKYLNDISLSFCMRRLEKDGLLKTSGKYVYVSLLGLTRGEIEEKIVEYEMGGARYSETYSEKLNEFKKLYISFKKQIDKLKF